MLKKKFNSYHYNNLIIDYSFQLTFFFFFLKIYTEDSQFWW